MASTDIGQLIHSLEPGAKVKLIEVDCTGFQGDLLRFHNYNVPHTEAELLAYQASGKDVPPKSLWFQGKEYSCWPYQLSGSALDGTGASPTPMLEVANIDGSISSLCLLLQNLFGAKVTEHTTFEQYLDGGTDADPEMEYQQVWWICRKAAEDDVTISFELSSPADLTGQELPKRSIHSMCHWAMNNGYRGPDCGYTGTKYFTEKGEPTTDPSKDKCGGCVRDCKLRQGAENQLTFGGFIASSLIS